MNFKKGCWLCFAQSCSGDAGKDSPVCNMCWKTAPGNELEAIKRKYNAKVVRIDGQPYCKMTGCWGVVKKCKVADGVCTRQIKEGKCDPDLSDGRKHHSPPPAAPPIRRRSQFPQRNMAVSPKREETHNMLMQAKREKSRSLSPDWADPKERSRSRSPYRSPPRTCRSRSEVAVRKEELNHMLLESQMLKKRAEIIETRILKMLNVNRKA